MGNPFKEKENAVAPRRKEAPVVIEPEEKPVEKVEKPKATPAPKKKETKKDILDGILEEKPGGKACSMFLDVDVIEELDRLSKGKKGLNRSKIANALLRKGLFGE